MINSRKPSESNDERFDRCLVIGALCFFHHSTFVIRHCRRDSNSFGISRSQLRLVSITQHQLLAFTRAVHFKFFSIFAD
jgi:hypothetical protein